MGTKTAVILTCKCVHEGQDRLYGKNQRVGNLLAKDAKSSTSTYRCSVCGTEHTTKE